MNDATMLLRVTATQIVVDLYEKNPRDYVVSVEEFVKDVEVMHKYLLKDLEDKEKGATVQPLRPVH